MANRKAAYGAPAEEREIIVTMDRRVLYGVGGLVLVLALLGGVWFAGRTGGGGTTAAGGPAPATGGPAPAAEGTPPLSLPDDVARATAVALGLGENINIVPAVEVIHSTVTPTPPGWVDPFADQKKQITPAAGAAAAAAAAAGAVDSPFGDLQPRPGDQAFAIPTDYVSKAENWTHDVLAGQPDPNLGDIKLVPERTEKVTTPLKGPRIGISGLSEFYTYDFGEVPMDKPVQHDFMAANVGDEDLIISRVYTGCGCTALSMGTQKLDGAGFLKPPMVLKPGQKVPFTVQFDPRAEGKGGPQAKYVQIYSNDDSKTLFEANDPNSYETRFRFVVEPKGKVVTASTPTPASQPAQP